MEARSVGLLVTGAGVVLLLLGVLIYSGALGWFGRLPGDIRIEGEHSRVYIPLVSMLLISVVLSLLLTLLRRFL
ncbi:MAG TPA: DUF2905 domain-containing protein [Longimicrobiaceae bacterium]|nr:DUF2905 domain-containing protein [Longimicrobiaceae bacterium]